VISVRSHQTWLLRLAMILAIAAASPRARAQDEDEPDAEAEAGVRVARRPLLSEQQFDLQIFGRNGSVESARSQLNQVLRAQLNRLHREYRLTAAQREKLFLAGQGDIKRALDRADELRRKFQLVKYERFELMECLQQARQMRSEFQGGSIFNVDSLLTKTIATTITQEQHANEDYLLREYQTRRYQEAVHETAARLAPVLNLTPEQHQRLKRLLLDEIPAPRRSGESSYAYIMYQLSRLPEARVRPIFGDSQWKFLHELLMCWSSAGPFLKNDGFVFDDSPATRWRKVAAPLDGRRGQTGN